MNTRRLLETYHVAGNAAASVLDDLLVRLANGDVVGAGRNAEEAVQIVDGHTVACHGRLEGIVCHAIGRHLAFKDVLEDVLVNLIQWVCLSGAGIRMGGRSSCQLRAGRDGGC